MGGFFETYVDPLTEIIKEKDEQIEFIKDQCPHLISRM